MEQRVGYLVAALTGAVVTAAIYEVSGAFADATAAFSGDELSDTEVMVEAEAEHGGEQLTEAEKAERVAKRKDRKTTQRQRRRGPREGADGEVVAGEVVDGEVPRAPEARGRMKDVLRDKFGILPGELATRRAADEIDAMGDEELFPAREGDEYPPELFDEDVVEATLSNPFGDEDTDYPPEE